MSEKREVIINCGISHVSASVFTSEGGKLKLKQVGLQTLHYDYSNDQIWLDSLVSGLELLCKKEKLKGDARFIFPGSLLLNKTIRVPHVDEEKQKKIVAFELSQKMPFPLAELIWDYQVIDDDGVEQEILAFAVKPEIAETFCEKVVEIGLNPLQITPAPTLDYNALISSGVGLEQQETLVVNIGAKSTNLLFINPTGFLIRSIAIGGNTLTQNISDNIGTVFEKAEEIKKSYFSGQVAFSPEDPSVQVLENCSQQFLTRASQEITRSIVTYKRLKKGKSPTRMFLSGRGALLNNLPEYISQSQSLNIDYFDPLKSLVIDEGVKQEMRALLPFMLGEPVGLATAIFNNNQKHVLKRPLNLLPANKLTNLSFKKKIPILLISMILISLLPIPNIFKNKLTEKDLTDKLSRMKNTSFALSDKVKQNELLEEKFIFIDKFNKLLLKRNVIFREKSFSCWILQDFLNQLQSSLDHVDVSDAWFDELRFGNDQNSKNQNLNRSTSKFETNKLKIILSGRYLIRITEDFTESQSAEKKNHLIELNSQKQESLTQYLESLPFIKKVEKKTFSIEGKGDLFKRYFTHFEYVFIPQSG
ncbi:MAG: pilus assembly protein PilM [Opitutales bacterium]|nr:pilus assembly protein PilM [Opitutales bacterium]